MTVNQQIKEYIKENPIHLRGHYQVVSDKFNVGYECVRHIARQIRKEIEFSEANPFKVVDKQLTEPKSGTPGGKFDPKALKEFVKDSWSDFEVVKKVDSKIERLAICSDLHGVFLDQKTFNCFIEVLKNNPFDEVVLNGDIFDFPLLSRHTSKLLNNGPMTGYSEVKEIEFGIENILKPLRNATNANIVFRQGNHTERVTSPFNISQSQLARLAILYHHYGTVKIDEMMDLRGLGIEYDPTPVRSYYDIFDILHGLSLAKNAQEQNIMARMNSGASSHTHRLGAKYITKADKEYVWIETGCMRLKKGVEYMPTGVTVDWASGFSTVRFDHNNQNKVKFFASCHPIIDGVTSFNDKIYGK